MSRQELAEAVNTYLYEQHRHHFVVDARYIGKLERGEHRWPFARYRTALRAVLGNVTDAELGFFVIHGHANDPDMRPVESPLVETPDGVPIDPVSTSAPSSCEANGQPPATRPEAGMVRVSVGTGAAVTVTCHDGPVSRVAVLAGPVELLVSQDGATPAPPSRPAATAPPAGHTSPDRHLPRRTTAGRSAESTTFASLS
ncbi:hypothetical protein [Micromonospora sp. SH-82]|uniref:hypothetical protein n=1 Tax=Micromonospora sp. SH-82 TaxID=3132938 RepID=UPI003EBCB96C